MEHGEDLIRFSTTPGLVPFGLVLFGAFSFSCIFRAFRALPCIQFSIHTQLHDGEGDLLPSTQQDNLPLFNPVRLWVRWLGTFRSSRLLSALHDL